MFALHAPITCYEVLEYACMPYILTHREALHVRQLPAVCHTHFLQEAIDILTHPESDTEHQHKALSALQILVEPIDNANGTCRCSDRRHILHVHVHRYVVGQQPGSTAI